MSGNGHKPFSVRERSLFSIQRKVVEREWPLLAEVFDALKRQFEVNPRYNARRLGSGPTETWFYKTKDGVNRPEVRVYYSIENKTVWLGAIYIHDYEIRIILNPSDDDGEDS